MEANIEALFRDPRQGRNANGLTNRVLKRLAEVPAMS
jgi:hypothetical protein